MNIIKYFRYYSVGSGETEVTIEGIEMTEIETLECQLPYVTEQLGGTFRCALDCHEQCSYHGCKTPLNSRECYSCQNAKVVIRREGVNLGYRKTNSIIRKIIIFIVKSYFNFGHLGKE